MKDVRDLKQGQQKARSGGGGTGCGTHLLFVRKQYVEPYGRKTLGTYGG